MCVLKTLIKLTSFFSVDCSVLASLKANFSAAHDHDNATNASPDDVRLKYSQKFHDEITTFIHTVTESL